MSTRKIEGIRKVELAKTIRRLHSLGWSNYRIGRHLGKWHTAISKWKVKMKLDPIPGDEIYKLTDAQLVELAKLFHQGWGSRKIAAHFGISKSTAYRYMQVLGLIRHKRNPTTMDDSDKADLSRMWGTKTRAELARYFGVSPETVTRWARHLGLLDHAP